jgi:hypothetical protein
LTLIFLDRQADSARNLGREAVSAMKSGGPRESFVKSGAIGLLGRDWMGIGGQG